MNAARRRVAMLCSIAVVAVAAVGAVSAQAWWPQTAKAEGNLLEPAKAFRFDARVADVDHVEVTFEVAPGYYMYREQFRFGASGATLGDAVLPAGQVKFDETFRKNVETYRGRVTIGLPVATPPASGRFVLDVANQGCSDRGVCYPPVVNHAEVRLVSADGGAGSVRVLPSTPYMPGSALGGPVGTSTGVDAALSPAVDGASPSVGSDTGSALSAALDQARPVEAASPLQDARPVSVATRSGDGIESALKSGRVASVIGVFVLAGLLLSLTPCVLPMLPILSSLIVGHQPRSTGLDEGVSAENAHSGRARSFGLAASYSLGMALVYTALGVAAGLAGEGLAAALQTPFVLGLFALLLVAFSLSMFGFYEMRLPAAVTGRLTRAANGVRGGRFAGVFVMGGLSALIVSPCVAAPLAGALVYISQTRDAVLGGVALFSLAIGMSVPLLLLGASATRLLPRTGAWMENVKRFFGVLLLAVAVWTVQPVLPPQAVLLMWGALLVGCAVALGLFEGPRGVQRSAGVAVIRKSVAVLAGIVGLMQLVGAASGGSDPLQPLAHFARPAGAVSEKGVAGGEGPAFAKVSSSAELDQAIRAAGRPVMLDFYADWCVSCKEMERFTFSDPAVKAKLAGALLLKADVTRNSPQDRELLRRFGLFGPPGIIFFDAKGAEHVDRRVIGFQPATAFAETLRSIGL